MTMLKKLIFTITAIFSVLFVYTSAIAAWSFNISTDYTTGDAQAIFNLNFSTDESASIGSYGLEFTFDNSELNYVSHTATAPAGMFGGMFGAFSYDQADGSISNFNASAFAPATVVAGNYQIGTFTFDVTDSVADGSTDFNFDYTDPMFAFFINGSASFDASEPQFALTNLTDIAPATQTPVPAAIWLFGSGIAGLACFRRKRAQ